MDDKNFKFSQHVNNMLCFILKQKKVANSYPQISTRNNVNNV